jgi:hypothetical protein
MKKVKKARFLTVLLSCLLVINTIISTPVLAASTDMDAFFKSTLNPPQSISEKAEVATWSYGALAVITPAVPDFIATSGYYATTPAGTKSTMSLFRNNAKVTSGFGYSTAMISNNTYNGQTDKGYWLISTSTKGFKNLIFNFNTRSSGTGPRDFNTEWSADGTNWTVFGNTNTTSPTTVKIETTSPAEQFGMILPVEAANQDTLYIRIIQKSDISEGGTAVVAAGGTHGVNSLQLYGVKDPLYTTPTVTVAPATTNAILDVTPITLSCEDTNAQIYYTTDGTTPATTVGGSTKLYSSSFTALSENGFIGVSPFVVKAIAKAPTLLSSDTVTLSYNQQMITSNENAKKLAIGTYAWVKGIGTYSNQNRTVYIQDGMNIGSGICIDKSGADFTTYLGKEIYVYGKVASYNGLTQIVPDIVNTTNVIVRNASPTLPTPTKIMFDQLSDRAYEGMLVAFDTVKLVSVLGTTVTSNYNHKVNQTGIEYTLRAKGIAPAVGTNGSYVNIKKAIANYFTGVQILSSNTLDLEATTSPTVEFMTTSVATGKEVPLNSKVTLATITPGATITYSLNGGAQVTSTTNSVEVTIDAFQSGKATITATATDGTYTTATQTFTYTQSQVATVLANPGIGAILPTTPITLSSTTNDATIVYSLYKNSYSTTDGTLVGDAFQTYTAPITLDASYFPIRIETKATLANYIDSKPLTLAYTLKKVVGGEKNYYGAIHGHTAENSDGQGTLVEANAYARDQGKFDYFILTDHSNSFDKAPATDTVATIGNLNNYNTANQQWVNGKSAAAAATTSTFLADYAYEMTWSGGPGHMNTFNTSGFASRNNAALNNKTNDAGMQAYYQLLKNTAGSISQFNHPGPTFGNFADFGYYDPAIDDKINLIEIGNGEGAVGSGGYFQSINQYILALDKGWHVAPSNNGDNHKKAWGTSNTVATVVYTNDFTMSGIYQAMRDRSVWATENRDLDVTYHLNDGTNTFSMGAILDAAPANANVTVTAKNKNVGTETSNIASIQLISNSGRVVNEKTYAAGTSDVTYTYAMTAPAAGYYFAKITDNQGFVALTAPIWTGSAPKVGIVSVKNSAVMPVTTEALTLTTTFFNNESTASTLKSISYTVDGDTIANKEYTPGTSIASLGKGTHEFTYIPTTPGTKIVNISAVITVNGVDFTFSTTSTMKVVEIDKVLYVGIDASHGNEYVSGGGYPNSMGNMMAVAASNSIRVVQLNTSQELIEACSNPKYKMIILNAPTRKNASAWPNPTNYTTTEIAAIKAFSENGNTLVFGVISDLGESPNYDSATPKKHMAELQNDILAKIGSTLRASDDQVMDDVTNGGQAYRLYMTELNKSNPLMQGVVDGQVYSQYKGASVYAVDPITGERTFTLPGTVSPLVYGLPTTYSAEIDNDNFGYGITKPEFPYVVAGTNPKTDKGMNNSQGLYIPKYINQNSTIATNPEEKLIVASENVLHSNGKTSLVVVAGGSFMSNFEIQVSLENSATLPYVNYNIMDNLYKSVNPITITSIADAKNLADGTDVIIEGIATSEVNTQSTDTNTNKGFFDCIYAQDETGGINLFPVGSGVQEGQKVRFYGKVSSYQGEVQLLVSKFTILDQNISKLAPTTVATKDSMLPTNTGLLLKTQGVVSNINKDVDGTINQFTINDGTGPAIVFINGYITKGVTLPFITEGATVSVVGLASIGEVVSDSDMHARIRVRDRSEIVNIDKTAPVITITGVEDGKLYKTNVTPVFNANEGIVTATLNGEEYKGEEITVDGKYELIVTAVDLAKNSSSVEINFTIDKTAPTITSNFNSGEIFERINSLSIIITAKDTGSGLINLETTLDGVKISNNEVINLEALAFGNHQIVATAEDKAGNIAIKEISFTITATLKTTIDLLKKFNDSGLLKNQGIYNSLNTKLSKGNLTAFRNEVLAQMGKGIDEHTSSILIEYLNWINVK